MITEDSYFG